jgi:hypothetical protein
LHQQAVIQRSTPAREVVPVCTCECNCITTYVGELAQHLGEARTHAGQRIGQCQITERSRQRGLLDMRCRELPLELVAALRRDE